MFLSTSHTNRHATMSAGLFCLFDGCLTSQQHASVSQERVCSDNCTCCHIEIEAADQTFYLTQSQCTDTGPTGPSADPITPGTWQGSYWSANFEVTGMTRFGKIASQEGLEPALEADALTTRPTRRSMSAGPSVTIWVGITANYEGTFGITFLCILQTPSHKCSIDSVLHC